jgi:hypothetical protein
VAGSNAHAARVALIAALAALTDPGEDLAGVAVAYSYNSRLLDASHREIVYGGKMAGPVGLAAMKGSARLKREEQVGLDLHIEVTTPGEETTSAADARCAAIGLVVENYLATNPTLGGTVPGLLKATVDNLECDGFPDDDAAFAMWTYRIVFHSYLT